MASKRKPVRRKSTRRASKRVSSSRFRRFTNALGMSAILSFTIASCALNPQLRDRVDLRPLLAQLDPFASSQQTAPTPIDGYVQTSFANCRQFFPNKKPPIVPAAPTLRELCFTPFAILHSGQMKTPVFVAQRLNRQRLTTAKGVTRKDGFYEERRLPHAERARLSDYRGSDFDRGHMAPAGDMHNDEAMAQSFSLANMVPQNAQHNRGAWSKIEADTRKYVLRAQGDVYVFTGAVYAGRAETIGDGRVAVPVYLYKVVYDATSGRSWVHWHENSADAKAGAPISYAEFVRRTNLNLLVSSRSAIREIIRFEVDG